MASDREGAIADLRHTGAVTVGLGLANSGAFAWRSTLALMLGPSGHDEALALTKAELDDARGADNARRIRIALRALGLLETDRDLGLSRLKGAADVLAVSTARLEHARALIELGAARRRARLRAAARAPLRAGLELATRCGAIRLAERRPPPRI